MLAKCRQAPSVTTIVDSSSFTTPPTGHTTSPRHRASSGKKKVVLLFPMAKFSRFLDLPAELRYNVYYYAMLPETLHVSLTGTKDARYTESFDLTTGKITKSPSRSLRNIMDRDSRKISFEHIFESQNKLMIKPFSISTFSVSRQIYGELQHLFYQKSTWYFDNLDSLVYSLIFLPSRVRMKIRHLAFSLKPIESPGHRFPRLKRGNRDQRWTFSSVSRLLESNLRLNTISIQYSKLGGFMEAGTNRELRQLSEGQKAACAVTEFVWPGISDVSLIWQCRDDRGPCGVCSDDMWARQRRMAVLWTGSILYASGRTSNLSQTGTFSWLATSLQNRALPWLGRQIP